MLIWTEVLYDIRELLLVFLSDNGVEVDRILIFRRSLSKNLKAVVFRIKKTEPATPVRVHPVSINPYP